ncbi:putative RDD family membrane protein YckC [Streptacidiphilus sp. MAP12-16]|uniref:RDD family protein n=1 Tax=Streptacidiphilus sp. MAP12-16 TaxID=3156300 RepID=UPI003512886E
MTSVPPAPGSETHGPSAGYYPDPSIPGFVRYWDGLGWLPGTSRPAPAPGEELPAPRAAARSSAPSMRFVPPPAPVMPQRVPAGPGGELEQSGPIFLDETGGLPAPAVAEPAPPTASTSTSASTSGSVSGSGSTSASSSSRWVADAAQQRGLLETASAPRWVSWGALPAELEEPVVELVVAEPATERRVETVTVEPLVEELEARVPRAALSEEPLVREPVGVEDQELMRAEYLALAQAEALAIDQARRADASRRQAARQGAPGTREAPMQRRPARPAPPSAPAPQPPPHPAPPRAAPTPPAQAPPASQHLAPTPPAPQHAAPPHPALSRPAPTPPVPTFQAPTPQAPTAQVPTPQASALQAPTSSAPTRPAPVPAPATSPPAGEPRRVPAGGSRPASPRPALLGRRLGARLVDLVAVVGAVTVVAVPLARQAITHIQDKIGAARSLSGETTVWLIDPLVLADAGLILLALLVVGFVYEALPTAAWGQTPGKALFGLRVLDRRSKQSPRLGRAVARWLSYQLLLVLLVGVFDLLWCMVDRPWRQCWHDKIGRTFVASTPPAQRRSTRAD